MVDSIRLHASSSYNETLSLDTAVDTLLIKKTEEYGIEVQDIKLSIQSSKDGILYLVLGFDNGKQDAFKLEEEDLEYITKVMSNKEFIFQRDGRFFRGRYVLCMRSSKKEEYKRKIEPVLILSQPKQVFPYSSGFWEPKYPKDEELDEVMDTEGIYRIVDVDYAYQKRHFDFMVFRSALPQFKLLDTKDLEYLIGQRMYLDLGYGVMEVLVVDIGKQRFYTDEIIEKQIESEVTPIELDPYVLVVPVDPLGGNGAGIDRDITDEEDFTVYLTHISTLREKKDVFKEDREFTIGYNGSSVYSVNPIPDGDSEFFIHRYKYVIPVSILKRLPLKERQKFFRPKLNFSNDEAYVTALRKNLSLNAYIKKVKDSESFSNEGSLHFTDNLNDRLIIWDSLIPRDSECKKIFGVF